VPRARKALVYLFRPDADGRGGLTSHEVFIDGRPILTLKWAEYTALYLPAGKHTASVGAALLGPTAATPLDFEVKPGEVGALTLAVLPKVMQPGLSVATSKGLFVMPSTPAPGQSPEPWNWGYFANIEELPLLYRELKKRWYRKPATNDFASP
jgi:hypothetical protein